MPIKVSELTEDTAPSGDDFVLAVDNLSGDSKKVSMTNLVEKGGSTPLALKANLASPTFTGTVTVPTPTTDTSAATKAYVDSVGASGVTAGAGLTKTGNTLDVGAGTGITVAADSVGIDSTVATLTGTQTLTNKTLTSPAITTPTGIVKGDVGLGNADNTSDLNKPISTATQTALDNKVDENAAITGATKTKITYDAKGLVTAGADATTTDIAEGTNLYYTDVRADGRITAQKGAANGLATLGADSKVPSAQLPSYVDDVLEYANLAGFPATGTAGIIYVALDTNKTYRWSGTAYVQITSGAVDSVNSRTGVVTGLAEDNAVVHLAGAETITGLKTFGYTGANREVIKDNDNHSWEQDGTGIWRFRNAWNLNDNSGFTWFSGSGAGVAERMKLTGGGNLTLGGALTLGTDLAITEGGTGASTAAGARTNLGAGDVVGPASSSNTGVARFDGTTGKLLKNSGVGIDDNNNTNITTATTSGVTLFLKDSSTAAVDTQRILSLNQSNVNASGNVAEILNAGSGYNLVLQNNDGINSRYLDLRSTADTHYPFIQWRDSAGVFQAGLTTHKYSSQTPPDNDHRHFTIYTSDANNAQQGRFYVEYGRTDIDISAVKLGTFKIRNVYATDTPERANRNYTDNALEVELNNLADNGNTYTLSGNVAKFSTTYSGTITSSVNTLYLENLRTASTGHGIVMDLRGTGNAIHFKNDTVDKFIVNASGAVTAGIWNGTDIAIADGGTGASTASAALTNLGAVAKAGDTMTGLLTLSGAPTVDLHAATKAYVDATKQGLDLKDSVRVATTTNGTLATAYANTQVVDGVTLATGDRILLKDQTAGAENGIYTVNATGAPTRATDADSSAEVTAGLYTFVAEGTTNADKGFVLTTNDPITLGTTALAFTQFSSAGNITAGAGLTKTGDTLDVVAGSTKLTVGADSIDVAEANLTLDNLGGTLGVAKGGTGATTAAGARTNLGLVIGTDVQAYNASTTLLGNTTTGTGSIVLAASPTITGTLTASNISLDSTSARDISVVQSSGTGTSLTISSGQSATGGTNTVGGQLILKSSAGTGNNSGAYISLQTPTDTASGTTTQTVSEKVRIGTSQYGRLSIGNVAGSADGITMSGVVTRSLLVARHTTSNTQGNTLTIQSGGATSGATDKAAGNLILTTGLSTGTGAGSVLIQTPTPGTTGTTDNAVATRMTLSSTGVVIPLGSQYSLQLSDTTGVAAGGVTFGTDVTLYRSAANTLKTDDTLFIADKLGAGIANGGSAYIETKSDASVQGVRVQGTNATDLGFSTFVAGDAQIRFTMRPDGQMAWGSGAAVTDTNLYRSAADTLKTDDKLIATAGIGVGNSAAATTLGAVTKKMEVFDASGVSLGFVPIYSSIT